MSAPDRRAMVERPGEDLSVRRQCALLSVARSGVYRPKAVVGADDLARDAPDRRTASRASVLRLAAHDLRTRTEGRGVNRKRVRRLMRAMGIEALVPRPSTSKPAPGHKIYPYLLRGLTIDGRTRCGRPTSPTSRWRAASSISWRSSTGSAGACSGMAAVEHDGGRASASRRWRRPAAVRQAARSSTPTRASSSPARRSPASSRTAGVAHLAWTARGRFMRQHVRRTAVALDRSMKRCISRPTTLSPKRALR